jgi:hypothetical protein
VLKLCCPPPSATAPGEEWERWSKRRLAALTALLQRAAEKSLPPGEVMPESALRACRYQAIILLDAGLVRAEEHLANDVQMLISEGVVKLAPESSDHAGTGGA